MKTCTLKQRLKLYKAALEEYRKYNRRNEFLCHLFENEFSVNFRLLKEVKELVPKKCLTAMWCLMKIGTAGIAEKE